MALVALASDLDIDGSSAATASQIEDKLAGQAILEFAPCYIAADGTVMMSNGTAANAAAEIIGWSARAAAAGEPVTLLNGKGGLRARYSSGLTPGATLYLGATAGRLDTAAQTGGPATGIAKAIDATDIYTIV
jgi:hypothetical protein